MKFRLVLMLLVTCTSAAQGQMRPPPAFIGGVPGMAQFKAIQMQGHQARTLLYREALDELRKNPAAADVPACPPGTAQGSLCLRQAEAAPASVEAAPAKEQAPRERRRFAVLVGNNDYKKPIPELDTPIADVSQTADILRSRFGYETRVLKNGSKAQIIEALNRVAAEAAPEDSVLLFYAGHGYLMDDTRMGFWIPVDGSVKTAANWISNTDISKLLAAIRAHQVILVSDSGFSGSLTREQKVSHGTLKAGDVLGRRSVVVLSSGGEEPVSDEGKGGHSIFAWNLIQALDAISGTTPGYAIWKEVHGGVSKEYPQEPQYGGVVSAGHSEGGDYLFQPR